MIRIVIENIILFLLPTVIYVGYVYLRRRSEPNLNASDIFDDAPLFWLFAVGAALAIASLAYFGSFDRGAPGQVYVPPSTENGRFIPGRYE
ncbi:MAG: DUF6111 family protein [Pseudomonadota bacterium]